MPNVAQLVAVASSTTNNATVSGAVTAVPRVGSLLTLVGRSSAVDSLLSISDGVNLWSIRANGHDNAMFLADCIVAADMTGATITCTLAANDANKVFWVHETVGVLQTAWFGAMSPSATVFFNGTARNVQGNTLAVPANGILFGWWSDASAETSLAAAANYADLPGLTGPGYYNGTSSFLEGVYRLVAVAESYQPTATGGASLLGYAAFSAYYLPAAPLPPHLSGYGAC